MPKSSIEMKNLLQRNIFLGYIISGLSWGRFFIPVLALFYIASQVTIIQFSIIMSVFTLAVFLLEIPTGIFADLIGKKNTLLLSRACFVAEVAIIAFFNGFWPFLIAKIISGIGVSLSSGTSSAFLFETLKKLRRISDHKKIIGVGHFISNVSMAFVFVIGAFLFSINSKLPAYVSLPFILLAFLLTFLLVEPSSVKRHNNRDNPLRHFLQAFKIFRQDKMLKYLSLLSFVTFGAVAVTQSFSSVYLQWIGISVSLIGVVAFVVSMLTAYFSKKTHVIEQYLGNKKALFIIQLVLGLAILCMSLLVPYVGVLFYLAISFVAGTSSILVSDYANVRIPSSHRSTLLSMNNMFGSLGNTLLFPFLGYLTDFFSLRFALLLFGLIVSLYCTVLFFIFKSSFKNNDS